ncbi:MAG TPA: hypothetical protein VKT77_18360, partial [Chthonomonadaceae bacterium]|nr:hypothetical protein [Chthonomonadaceae bacterium]
LLVSDWGRQMMGTNVEAARLWLSQIGDHLQQAPIFGVIIAALAAALGSIGDAAARTFSTLNGVAAQTLAIEVSLGLAACFVLSARRRVTLSGP